MRRVRRRELVANVFLFDLLYHNDALLLDLPSVERRERLERLPLGEDGWVVPPYQAGGGPRVLEVSKEHGLEGVIAKRLDSRYEPGRRSGAWIKVKNNLRQEVVVGGWLRGSPIGPLLVGYHDNKGLRYAGRVVLGMERWADSVWERLHTKITTKSAFYDRPAMKEATWFGCGARNFAIICGAIHFLTHLWQSLIGGTARMKSVLIFTIVHLPLVPSMKTYVASQTGHQ